LYNVGDSLIRKQHSKLTQHLVPGSELAIKLLYKEAPWCRWLARKTLLRC